MVAMIEQLNINKQDWLVQHSSDMIAIVFGLTGSIMALVGLIAIFVSLNTQHNLQKCRELYWEMVSMSYKEETYENLNRKKAAKRKGNKEESPAAEELSFFVDEEFEFDDQRFYLENFKSFYEKFMLYKEIFESEPRNFFTMDIIKTASNAIKIVTGIWVSLLLYFLPFFYLGEYLYLLLIFPLCVYILYRFNNYLLELRTVTSKNLHHPDEILDASKVSVTNINLYAILFPHIELIVKSTYAPEVGLMKELYLATPYKIKGLTVSFATVFAHPVDGDRSEGYYDIAGADGIQLNETVKIEGYGSPFSREKYYYKLLDVREYEDLRFSEYDRNVGMHVIFLDENKGRNYVLLFNFVLEDRQEGFREYLPFGLVKN